MLKRIKVIAEMALRIGNWTVVGIGGLALALPLNISQLIGLAADVITPA
jgi:hypothetical protein